jgi:hypothetical protein
MEGEGDNFPKLPVTQGPRLTAFLYLIFIIVHTIQMYFRFYRCKLKTLEFWWFFVTEASKLHSPGPESYGGTAWPVCFLMWTASVVCNCSKLQNSGTVTC